jgi:putative oxidoreductase
MNEAIPMLPPRVALGSTLLYHGQHKLTPEGLAQTQQMFEKIGIRPGARWARLVGITELVAGALFLAGIGTRVAAVATLVTQAVAVAKVHAKNGFSVMKGGYEFNAALIAMSLAVLFGGPGRASTHQLVKRRWGRPLSRSILAELVQ